MNEEDYALLSDNPKENEDCRKEIAKLNKEYAKKLKAIEKQYPNCGIGDTQTDELIVNDLYSRIH